MTIRTVGVVGAGTMGIGVSQLMAENGYPTVLVDNDSSALVRARQAIHNGLRTRRLFAGSTVDVEATLKIITFTTDLGELSDVDYLVENATERWEVKAGIYPDLDRICPSHTVFGVNTSAVPITRIGGLTGRADRVIGTHFMNPAPMKPLVEVIKGYHTSAETIALTGALMESLGKAHIVVNDSPGFVTNRVLMLTINEAVYTLHEDVSSAVDIDMLFKQCFGHQMGPLETADLIGLDTVLLSLEVLLENFQDPKYRPCVLLRQLVAAGRLGCKSGAGFHEYNSVMTGAAR
ncbi:3-hydroxybutyryl-CoA dehydrogenase [Nonomuraea sp. K274]|uniref:3-hydroxybutyryl-CoA dehydrogenase n=1 Tax=Nonomuraea cypriaca TaxID=1187855 RepID=A0A931AAJ9_9ACTN|nr:3-hydroxyacyl-CoA dehydrogenase NAD-binding domain-containing protein [Nonomuraea cypriaca]MBF8187068.1 3-hydroxybutyryl-CoA dehydrogenase [Nonomuraea cypriaca]